MSLKIISSDRMVFYNVFDNSDGFLNSRILPALLAQQTNSVSYLSLTKTRKLHSANLSVLADELDFNISCLATGRKNK